MVKYNGKDFTEAEFQKMIDAGLIGQKNDLLSSNFGQAPHGFQQQYPAEGGVFSRPGADPNVFNTVPGVPGTLAERIYRGTDIYDSPEFELLSGVDDATGSNPTDFTGTPPVVGNVKAATHRQPFGEFYLGTNKLQIPKTGGYINRADYDRRLISMMNQSPLLPAIMPDTINTELGLQALAFNTYFTRVISRVLFNGDYRQTNANTETGFIREFDGYDRLIRTGYVDLETQTAVPALDSTVVDFGSDDVTTSAGTDKIVSILAEIYNKLENLSADTGLSMTSWTLAMRRDMFYAITENYPRSYLTISNNVTTDANGERVTVDSQRMTDARDAMRNGRYLMIMGIQVPVAIENGIPKTAVSNGFSSSIYMIPLTAGGQRATYLEAFDQNNDSVTQLIQTSNMNARILNNGLWSVAAGQTGLGVELYFGARMRLVLRTPHLAARVENIVYNFNQQIYPRDAYPSEAYYANGGRYLSDAYYTA